LLKTDGYERAIAKLNHDLVWKEPFASPFKRI